MITFLRRLGVEFTGSHGGTSCGYICLCTFDLFSFVLCVFERTPNEAFFDVVAAFKLNIVLGIFVALGVGVGDTNALANDSI